MDRESGEGQRGRGGGGNLTPTPSSDVSKSISEGKKGGPWERLYWQMPTADDFAYTYKDITTWCSSMFPHLCQAKECESELEDGDRDPPPPPVDRPLPLPSRCVARPRPLSARLPPPRREEPRFNRRSAGRRPREGPRKRERERERDLCHGIRRRGAAEKAGGDAMGKYGGRAPPSFRSLLGGSGGLLFRSGVERRKEEERPFFSSGMTAKIRNEVLLKVSAAHFASAGIGGKNRTRR